MDLQKFLTEALKGFGYHKYKIPIWRILKYSVELKTALAGKINLCIE